MNIKELFIATVRAGLEVMRPQHLEFSSFTYFGKVILVYHFIEKAFSDI